ncbi:MAG TPA: hypothetical protein VGG61_00735 [Gemmataceae bacterium]
MAARAANVRSVVSDAQDKGREAVEAVSEVRDNVAVAIDKSLKKRPYTTLALAGAWFSARGHLGALVQNRRCHFFCSAVGTDARPRR